MVAQKKKLAAAADESDTLDAFVALGGGQDKSGDISADKLRKVRAGQEWASVGHEAMRTRCRALVHACRLLLVWCSSVLCAAQHSHVPAASLPHARHAGAMPPVFPVKVMLTDSCRARPPCLAACGRAPSLCRWCASLGSRLTSRR